MHGAADRGEGGRPGPPLATALAGGGMSGWRRAAALCWLAGISASFLGVGVAGMFRPVMDVELEPVLPAKQEVEVPLEEITMADLPGEPAPETDSPPELPETPVEDEVMEEPLTVEDIEEVPESPEIEPALDLLPEREEKRDRPPERRAEPQPRPRPAQRAPRPKPTPVVTAPGGTGAGGARGTTVSARGSGGRFPQPNYPAFARARGLSGTVMLDIRVNPDGTVASVAVVRSTGSRELDEHAAGFVRRRWRWPEGGARRYQLPVSFRLR